MRNTAVFCCVASLLFIQSNFLNAAGKKIDPHDCQLQPNGRVVICEHKEKAKSCGELQIDEFKMVCVDGPNAGHGYDLWCRMGGDHKCNIRSADVCPSPAQLTQWSMIDHCDHRLQSNWTPPSDWHLALKKK